MKLFLALIRPVAYLAGGYLLGRWVLGPLLILAFAGCASSGLYSMSDGWCAAHPDAAHAHCARPPSTTHCQYGEHPGDTACTSAQSWDQANLKRNDIGCPHAIYDAPGGNLRLCPTS